MLSVIRIIIGILVFLFGFYMYLCRYEARGMRGNLTKEEKRYLDILEWWFYISTIYAIPGILLIPLFQ